MFGAKEPRTAWLKSMKWGWKPLLANLRHDSHRVGSPYLYEYHKPRPLRSTPVAFHASQGLLLASVHLILRVLLIPSQRHLFLLPLQNNNEIRSATKDLILDSAHFTSSFHGISVCHSRSHALAHSLLGYHLKHANTRWCRQQSQLLFQSHSGKSDIC